MSHVIGQASARRTVALISAAARFGLVLTAQAAPLTRAARTASLTRAARTASLTRAARTASLTRAAQTASLTRAAQTTPLTRAAQAAPLTRAAQTAPLTRAAQTASLASVVATQALDSPAATGASDIANLGTAGWTVQSSAVATQTGAQISTPGFSTCSWLPVSNDDAGGPGTEIEALAQNGQCPRDTALQPVNQNTSGPDSVFFSNNLQLCYGVTWNSADLQGPSPVVSVSGWNVPKIDIPG